MLSDRSYMRDSYGRSPGLSALAWLIIAIAGGFVVENIFLRWFGGSVGEWFMRLLTLSPEGISRGFVWSLVTHAFLHSPDNLLHLGLTLLMLYLFGRNVMEEIGPRRMLKVFALAVAAGGLAWLAVNWSHGGLLFGASAGVSALIILFVCLHPHQPITFFMIDIGMKARHLGIGMVVIDTLGLILLELPGKSSWFAMPHSAHLGGILAGWLYYRVSVREDWKPAFSRPSVELPRWLRKNRQADLPPAPYKVNLSEPRVENLSAEVDRILDKINSHGFHSLTEEERRRLDRAREHLSRR